MNKHTEQMVEALLSILDPIESHTRARLREIATELKQMDGEHWAVGEMLERGCIFLDAYEMSSRHGEQTVAPDRAGRYITILCPVCRRFHRKDEYCQNPPRR